MFFPSVGAGVRVWGFTRALALLYKCCLFSSILYRFLEDLLFPGFKYGAKSGCFTHLGFILHSCYSFFSFAEDTTGSTATCLLRRCLIFQIKMPSGFGVDSIGHPQMPSYVVVVGVVCSVLGREQRPSHRLRPLLIL